MTEQEIIQIVQTWLNNNFQKTKVSQLATASSLTGLYVLGFLANGSVKAPIELLKGNAGKSVELRNNNGELQWRVEGGTWAVLYEKAELQGKDGEPFKYEDFTQEQLDQLAQSVGDGLEFSSNTTHIQYRLKGGTWVDVVSLELLKGDKGDKGDTGAKGDKGDKGDTGLTGPANTLSIGTVQGGANAGASITGAAPNQTLNLTLPKGDTGSNIELQKTTTHVQWRVVGGTWANLIPLSDLKGEQGDNISLQKTATHIQWRLGTGTWTNLVALTELKGEKGDAPVKGVDYFDGKNAVMTIGTITTVASNAQANATVVADGVDAEGKPKFKLNLWLPKGVDGEGAGDMLKSVYDPTGKNTDVFGYVDNKVKTDVPVNAKFTDTTYTEISEAEINTGTASTLRTITARRVTFILSKAQTLVNNAISALTKSSVGLGNVDNVKQASKTEFDTHNSDSTRHITSSERTAWNAKGSSNLALGETSATAYRGDRGKIAYDHSQTTHAPSNAQKNSDITKAEIEAKLTGAITTHSHTVTKANVGLENVDNTSDANKPVSTAQQTALNAKMDSSKFQVVESLPASPVSGTFYFVKE